MYRRSVDRSLPSFRSLLAQLIDQLKINGRMIVPVGRSVFQELLQIDKLPDGRVTSRTVTDVSYVPLGDPY